jgi:urea transport system substrate-binding protein
MGLFYCELDMTALRLGILYSTTGAYGPLGVDCRDGALLAIDDLRAEGKLPFAIEPVFADPAGQGERYLDLARDLVRDQGCRHILGTITSQARKDVIPIVEKHDAQLWYVCPYEGFEANENVIYTGACPNQHLVPLLDYLLPRFGKRVYLAGANYVWGWEMNRLARELVAEAGGEILAERCLPVEETDVGRLVADVATRRPDVILNNLIGPSSHAFLRAMRELGQRDPRFTPDRCPVASCDLTEAELGEIGFGLADGQWSAASYFDSQDTPENQDFKARIAARFGTGRRASSFFASSYATVRLCAEAVAACGSDDPAQTRAYLHGRPLRSVLGSLTIDPRTNHAGLPFHLGRIRCDGFDIVQSRSIMAADPYLTGKRPLLRPATSAKHLRIVS